MQRTTVATHCKHITTVPSAGIQLHCILNKPMNVARALRVSTADAKL